MQSFMQKIKINVFKNHINRYKFLLKVINLYYWKSIIGPLITFFFTPLWAFGLTLIYKDIIELILPSLTSNPVILTPFWVIGTIVVDLKKNSILEKYFIFSKKPIHTNAILFCYFLFIVIIGYFWNLLLIFLLTLTNLFERSIFINVNWGQTIFVAFQAAFLSLSIVSVTYTLINVNLINQGVNFIFSVFSLFLSGQIIPIYFIANQNVLNVIAYFSPFRYINSSLTIAMNNTIGISNVNGVGIFDLGQEFVIKMVRNVDGQTMITEEDFVLFKNYDLYLNLFIPFLIIISSLAFSLNKRIGLKK